MRKNLNCDCKSVSEINFETLKNILHDNANTEYGIEHNFSKIETIEDYRKYVPLSEYHDFEKYIDRMYDGEQNILTAYPIEVFVFTSGTVGKPKLIPLTKKALDVYSNNFKRDKNAIVRSNREKNPKASRLFVTIFRTDLSKPHDKNMLFSEIVYRYLYDNGCMNMNEYVGGKELLFDEKTLDMFYMKLWSAILDENIVLIESVYMYDLFQFFSFFEKNYKKVISNIREKVIPDGVKLSDQVRKKLLELPVSADRLDFVEQECSKGFEGIVPRIWPKTQLISGISSSTFKYENKGLDRYLGNVHKDFLEFAMSESQVGVTVKLDSFEYEFVANSAFYEFIPCNENGEYCGQIVSIDKLEIGKLYELVLTNLSGLYRYKTGDVLRILNNSDEQVIFEFVFRKNLVLNLAGEKISAKNIEVVMEEMDKVVPGILEYTFGATIIDNMGRYFVFLCLKDNNIALSNDELSEILDSILSEVNCLYKELRHLNFIVKPVVYVNNEEEYSSIMNKKSVERKHNKPVNILSATKLNKILERYDNNEKDFV